MKQTVKLNELINTEVKEYNMLKLDKIGSNSMREEILLENPKLYNTPIVRNGRKATIGYKPEVWADWE